MGMYTEIFVNMEFKLDTPESVLELIEAVINKDTDYMRRHEHPKRWAFLTCDMSCYTPQTRASYWDRGSRSLLIKGDIKNYGGEIEEFFELISPWGADKGRMIGYAHYEESKDPHEFFYADGEWTK